MAIVPLLLIRMKVMMAIRMSGIFLPQSVKAKTSLGLGQGSVVDMRTVMYEIRKQLKMKVSLRRKIHIMALPQGTFLNARWSEDQSATMPWNPSGNATGSAVPVRESGVIFHGPVTGSRRASANLPAYSLKTPDHKRQPKPQPGRTREHNT